jgi:hypothetical protein
MDEAPRTAMCRNTWQYKYISVSYFVATDEQKCESEKETKKKCHTSISVELLASK